MSRITITHHFSFCRFVYHVAPVKKIAYQYSSYIPRDGRSHMNRGFGFVRFAKKEEAEDAIAAKVGFL